MIVVLKTQICSNAFDILQNNLSITWISHLLMHNFNLRRHSAELSRVRIHNTHRCTHLRTMNHNPSTCGVTTFHPISDNSPTTPELLPSHGRLGCMALCLPFYLISPSIPSLPYFLNFPSLFDILFFSFLLCYLSFPLFLWHVGWCAREPCKWGGRNMVAHIHKKTSGVFQGTSAVSLWYLYIS